MSIWEQYHIEATIIDILGELQPIPVEHHFGRPYMSAYQLAIEFAQRAPDAFAAIGKPIGGTGTGQHNSLAQYLAGQLSRRIKNQPDYPIEGSFLANRHLQDVAFDTGETVIHASTTDAGWDLSMFRLRTTGDS